MKSGRRCRDKNAVEITGLTGIFDLFQEELCALFLEKYLLTITGFATFMILIPAACVLVVVWTFKRQEVLKRLAVKYVLLGLAIYLVVPASVKVSGLIEKTYQASIDSTIEAATGAKDEK